jgi:hypothetical protein
MHRKRIFHNRLNLSNILFDKDGNLFVNILEISSKMLSDK